MNERMKNKRKGIYERTNSIKPKRRRQVSKKIGEFEIIFTFEEDIIFYFKYIPFKKKILLTQEKSHF